MEPSFAFQAALFESLSGALSVPVFDEPPLHTPLPYAQIGDDAWTEDDSHDFRSWIGVVSIEVWDSTTAGRSTIKKILSELDNQIHNQPLAVADYVVNWIRYQASSTARADDRPLYRGLISFEVRLQQSS